jgi:hypothetical protein
MNLNEDYLCFAHGYEEVGKFTYEHVSTSPNFQEIFKTAQKAYKALPWWKRLFKYDFAAFTESKGEYLTYWN